MDHIWKNIWDEYYLCITCNLLKHFFKSHIFYYQNFKLTVPPVYTLGDVGRHIAKDTSSYLGKDIIEPSCNDMVLESVMK